MTSRPIPALVLLAALAATAAPIPARADQPNVLLVLADDLGPEHFAPLGLGATPAHTPNLDALAAEGLLFTHAWSTPACASTRASLLTGRLPFRHGVGTTTDRVALPHGEVLLPEALPGYSTACFGKWHLGASQELGGRFAPNLAGCGRFTGMLYNQQPEHDREGLYYYNSVWTTDGENEHPGTDQRRYATSRLTDEVLEWTAQAPEPWFVYLAELAPHAPYEWPPAELHRGSSPGDSVLSRYHSVIEALDTELGRLFAGLPPDTLIVFASDNGTPAHLERPPVPDPPGPQRRAKMTVYEGGVRVPLIISGPGVPAATIHHPVQLTDLFATVLELAGAPLPPVPLDSVSLAPYFDDPDRPPLRSFAYTERFHPNGPQGENRKTMYSLAAYDGRYKVLNNRGEPVPPDSTPVGPEMYDLAADPFESEDLLEGALTPEEESAYRALLDFIQGLLGSSRGR